MYDMSGRAKAKGDGAIPPHTEGILKKSLESNPVTVVCDQNSFLHGLKQNRTEPKQKKWQDTQGCAHKQIKQTRT